MKKNRAALTKLLDREEWHASQRAVPLYQSVRAFVAGYGKPWWSFGLF